LLETQRRLKALDRPETASRHKAVLYPSTATSQLEETKEDSDESHDSAVSADSLNAKSVGGLREDLAMELTSPLGNVTYPANLTAANFTDFLFCPTLCYELEYPRTAGTNWSELLIKTLAVFGCIFLLTVTSEEFVLPVLVDASLRMQMSKSPLDMSLILAESISRLLFPFMVSFLLVFLVIFEYICNAFAEITCKFSHLFASGIKRRQALQTDVSIQIGGTRATGSNFLESGTFQCIIFSAGTSTEHPYTTCPSHWLWL
jgi:sterol O-acyltransferase